MVTIPDPSDGGAWDYAEDYTAGGIANGTNLTTHNTDFSITLGTGTQWLYSTAASAFSNTSTVVTYLVYNALADGADTELLCLIRQNDWTATDGAAIPSIRHAGGTTGYGWRRRSDNAFHVWEYGATGSIGSQAVALTDGAEVWLRIQNIGDDIKARAWVDGQPEPGWQVEVTDGTWTGDLPVIVSVGLSGGGVAHLLAYAVQDGPTAAVVVAVGAAAEVDTAGSVTVATGTATVAVGTAAEADTAGAVAPTLSGVFVAVGVAVEVDTAGVGVAPVASGVASRPIGTAAEVDTAGAVTIAGVVATAARFATSGRPRATLATSGTEAATMAARG